MPCATPSAPPPPVAGSVRRPAATARRRSTSSRSNEILSPSMRSTHPRISSGTGRDGLPALDPVDFGQRELVLDAVTTAVLLDPVQVEERLLGAARQGMIEADVGPGHRHLVDVVVVDRGAQLLLADLMAQVADDRVRPSRGVALGGRLVEDLPGLGVSVHLPMAEMADEGQVGGQLVAPAVNVQAGPGGGGGTATGLEETGRTAEPVSSDELRIEPDRLVVIGYRPVVVPLAAPDIAPVDIGIGVSRVEPDRLVEVGQRLVRLLLVVPDEAPVVVGDGGFRVEPDRLVEVGQRLVRLPHFAPDEAPIVAGRCVSALISRIKRA